MIPESYKKIVLVIMIIAVIGAIFYLESRKVQKGSSGGEGATIVSTISEDENDRKRVDQKEGLYERAKEISTPDAFINVDNINIEELIGEKVILVDFWTYSCINCQRTLPHLNSWHESYEDDGLVIIGVHTPEFEFEKKLANVQAAVDKFGVEYPVVLDNDYSTWRSYNNRYWPRKYLIDVDGFIVYDHIGEGSYDETEREIVEALKEKNRVLGISNEVESSGSDVDAADLDSVGTPEIYFGSSRLEYLANSPQGDCLGKVCEYQAPQSLERNHFALDGSWSIGKESAVLESTPGEINLNFNARSVNIVAGSVDNEGVSIRVFLDDELIDDSSAGSDVSGGVVEINSHDLYNLVDLGEGDNHKLRIEILDSGLEAFTFTFG